MENSPAPRPQRTRQHPVADNPLRLLDAEIGLDWNLAGLRQKARGFTQSTAHAGAPPRLACEPAQAFCPRLRTPADYAAAAEALDDGLELATAIAFYPDHWLQPTLPIGQANLLLLHAEGLPPGDLRRWEWIGQALLTWDGRQGVERLEDAVDEVTREAATGALAAVPTSVAVLRARIDEIFERLIAETLEEIGGIDLSTVPTAVWLVNTLEHLRGLPLPEGAIPAAEDRLAERLGAPDRDFLRGLDSLRLGELGNGNPPPVRPPKLQPPTGVQVDTLMERFRQARAADALASPRPALSQRLALARTEAGFDARRLLAGWQVGSLSGRWLAAAELIDGIDAKTLDHFPSLDLRQTLRVGLRVVPSLAAVEATGGTDTEVVENAAAMLDRLKAEFAGCVAFIERLEAALLRLRRGEGALPLVVPSGGRGGEKGMFDAAWERAKGGTERWKSRWTRPSRPAPVRSASPPRFAPGATTLAGAGLAALSLVAVGYYYALSGNSGGGPARVTTPVAPAAAAPPIPRPTDPNLWTDSRGRTYRLPPGAAADLQAEEAIIERKRREVQEMASGLESLRQRTERERPGRGGFSAGGGGDPSTAQARFEAKLHGIQRERELVREQERLLQTLTEAHRARLDHLPTASNSPGSGGRG